MPRPKLCFSFSRAGGVARPCKSQRQHSQCLQFSNKSIPQILFHFQRLTTCSVLGPVTTFSYFRHCVFRFRRISGRQRPCCINNRSLQCRRKNNFQADISHFAPIFMESVSSKTCLRRDCSLLPKSRSRAIKSIDTQHHFKSSDLLIFRTATASAAASCEISIYYYNVVVILDGFPRFRAPRFCNKPRDSLQ